MTEERRAPVQGDTGWLVPRRFPSAKGPGTISWAEHLEAYAAYSKRYGTSQSAERMAERGGFSRGELKMFLGREPTTFQECK